ncbi:DUF4240 domain-containing protein [Streptomyces sp. ISL-1]|uniref:DUF4240 domain-containing protein n=1 Tax=Streptomyces sp. ISL-1 TaxID=2817657 RepID=UPI001BEC1CE8|nr:DUF4240 domain-containing protein [Streptomyces sp. ISL-1]MBT2392328.1 DUF4240 domain-containing protein [Streptomyces sp. ISL-1]
MHIDQFWNVIESARAAAVGAGKPFDEALVDRLATCPKRDILEYQERFDEVHDALYRWDVWAAAYVIGGGCSDDSFMDFRAGLISLGREWYERAAACPDSLADHRAVVDASSAYRDEALFYEEVNYAAGEAFERITAGGEDFYQAWDRFRLERLPSEESDGDMGEDFDFDDPKEMHRRLPRLAALYLRANAA